ncbi:unnamed protein product [Cylicocyclus nassatus]|uniref:Integrase catalytic domain-containing protein n=1 Tax=Cylicocyclus nassatus TaxID=53992 RepID=A0AA36DMV3_CYLNA|nr:unnamed protein product [Cylicocyclus nassatus]
MIDHFSKYVIAVALPNCKTTTVAQAIMDHCIFKYGVMSQLISDNAPYFRGEVMTTSESSNSADKPRDGTSSDSPQGSQEMATTDTNVATAVNTSRTPSFASHELLASNTPIQPRSGNPQTTPAPSTSPQHLPVGPDIQATSKQSLPPRSGTSPTISLPQQSVDLPSTSRAQPTPPNSLPPRQSPQGQQRISRPPQINKYSRKRRYPSSRRQKSFKRPARGPAQAEWLQRRTADDYWHYLMDMHPWARHVKPRPLRREDLTEAQISNVLPEDTYRQGAGEAVTITKSLCKFEWPQVQEDEILFTQSRRQVSCAVRFSEPPASLTARDWLCRQVEYFFPAYPDEGMAPLAVMKAQDDDAKWFCDRMGPFNNLIDKHDQAIRRMGKVYSMACAALAAYTTMYDDHRTHRVTGTVPSLTSYPLQIEFTLSDMSSETG